MNVTQPIWNEKLCHHCLNDAACNLPMKSIKWMLLGVRARMYSPELQKRKKLAPTNFLPQKISTKKWPKNDLKLPKKAQKWPKIAQIGPKMTQNGPKISTVHKILNLKGIYAILSRISKCRKSRVLVLIFWVKKLVGANFLRFCNSAIGDNGLA